MARSKSKNVGLIGLGIIGSRVAGALRQKGFQVFVWNRTPRPEQNFLGSPAEVAEVCDLVQIFVSDDEALLETVRQLTPTLTAQHVVTAHSTVGPETMRAAAEIVQRRGARFLDAPFTGSKVAAEKGQLVYYLAGDEAALKQVRPMLEGSSKEIVLISERIGDAAIMKVATNLITAATAQVAAEALALIRKSGIEPEVFQRAMKYNASNSTTLEMKVPMMLSGDFEPHFSVKHMLKDVRIGLKLAESHFLTLPVTDLAGDMLLAEMKKGRGDADYASLAQRYFPSNQPFVGQEGSKATPPLNPEPAVAAKEPPPTPASSPIIKGSTPALSNDKEGTKEEEPGPTENLSGGIRGWLSRLSSSSRRAP
jgi:3-hydroxyisobutyrate dehydrogenase-like beta-hydroxyacid dehydrogenase